MNLVSLYCCVEAGCLGQCLPKCEMNMEHFAESLIQYLRKVSEWCDQCWMKLNANKTKIMKVSWSHTIHPQSPPFTVTIGGTMLNESDNLDMEGVTFDYKMTLRSIMTDDF